MASCWSGGRIWAGSPTATQPMGTTAAAARTLLTWTTPLMRTSGPTPMRAPVAKNTTSLKDRFWPQDHAWCAALEIVTRALN
jgi:hypothetical protein